jgi:hypothetical protein
LSTALLDKFWARMSEIYGHRWVSSYGAAPSDTWARGLAGMTREQLARGLAACLKTGYEWPPTLPGFCKLCLTIPGVPSEDEAWADALQIARRWKQPHQSQHAAVWHALSQIGDFNGIDEEVLEKRFRKNYEQATRMLATGGELSPIPQPLPKPQDVRPIPAPASVREAALAKIEAMFGRRAS